MRRVFLEPEMEVVKFQEEDIITTSLVEDNGSTDMDGNIDL